MRTLASRSLVVPVFFLLFFVLPASVRADEIIITDGYLTIQRLGSGPTFSFGNPSQGFNVSNVGYTQGDGGGFGPVCSPCVAGQSISINGHFAGGSTLGYGPATVNGVSYERVYFQPASLNFNAPTIIVPLDNSPLVTINVPFTLTGSIGLTLNPDQPPAFFTTTLGGQGIATLILNSYFTETNGWLHDFQSVTFNFSPAPEAVPEPATLILFGTGLAAVATRDRRRRRSKDRLER